MARLSAPAIVRMWEAGLPRGPVDRALIMLGVASPDLSHDDLESLPIGERDARLFRVHAATFGEALHAHAACAACGERVEFDVTVRDMLGDEPAIGDAAMLRFEAGSLDIQLRLLTSRDLLSVAGSDPVEVGKTLARRSVAAVTRDGARIEAGDLPDEILKEIGERISAADPHADLTIRLTCPHCAAAWETPFDIAGFLWTELAAEAQRLIAHVHIFARAYGWCEADVFALSPMRRQAYLNLIGS